MSENVKISAAIVTASDSRTIGDDLSGDRLKLLLEASGAEVLYRSVVSDDHAAIREELLSLTERSDINLIFTTGGTGLGPRDCTPEATLSVIDREVPGICEAMRRDTVAKTPTAILSRSVAGIRNGTLIVNLPGSPRGVAECFGVIAPILGHAVRMVSGDTEH
ncbi:MAG: MogA/MoaB family molybdenum cofactor biosynthesis protein [Pyrinomonadaceae bacterium]